MKKKNVPIQGYVHDFGMSVKKGETATGGTPGYVAPEIVQKVSSERTLKDDSFALGTSLLETVAPNVWMSLKNKLSADAVDNFGLALFDDDRMTAAILKKLVESIILSGGTPDEQALCLEMMLVAKQLLKINPNERLSCEEAAKQLESLTKKYPINKPAKLIPIVTSLKKLIEK